VPPRRLTVFPPLLRRPQQPSPVTTGACSSHSHATLLIYSEPPPPLLCPESTASGRLLLSPVQPSRAPPAAVQAPLVQSAAVPRSLPKRSYVTTPPPHALRGRLAERVHMRYMGCLQRRPWLSREESCSCSVLVHLETLQIHSK
jgi:hypothetical protein